MKQQQQKHATTTADGFVVGTLYTLLLSVDHYAVLVKHMPHNFTAKCHPL